MSEKLISGEIDGKPFNAFITSNKPPCEKGGEHQWGGDEIMTFHNDDRVLSRTQFEMLPKQERERLNQASGEDSCRKCGIGAMSYDNPYYCEI